MLIIENHGPALVRLQQILAGKAAAEVGVATNLKEAKWNTFQP